MIHLASQSHRQRSLPPPFAQGRLLCCPAPDRPSFYGLARQRSMAVAARHRVMVYHTRSTTAPLVQRGDSMAKPCRGDWRGGPAAILSPAVRFASLGAPAPAGVGSPAPEHSGQHRNQPETGTAVRPPDRRHWARTARSISRISRMVGFSRKG